MTQTRIAIEWATLASQTAQITDTEARAIDPRNGQLLPHLGEQVASLYRNRLDTALVLIGAGATTDEIAAVTGIAG